MQRIHVFQLIQIRRFMVKRVLKPDTNCTISSLIRASISELRRKKRKYTKKNNKIHFGRSIDPGLYSSADRIF